MYERYLADPQAVPESWRDFFADYKADAPSLTPAAPTPAPSAPVAPSGGNGAPAPAAAPPAKASAAAPAAAPVGEVLRGASARIVANMSASLQVPTATSFREIPAKLIEINRQVINGYLSRTRGGKVSFTHIIGYAVVRAIADAVPAMNNTFVEGPDGKPRKITNEKVNLGLAVDLEKKDGTRTLMVPVIRDAAGLDFAGFWAA
ncbi:MAG: multifunctional 2-oxoglutarate metabolism enzyme, partial [Acidimicrobiia bacterium]|nr:multifunctional 2-oxoglutarate metabolism enzyme [Acidimicrobiia bacterium]